MSLLENKALVDNNLHSQHLLVREMAEPTSPENARWGKGTKYDWAPHFIIYLYSDESSFNSNCCPDP